MTALVVLAGIGAGVLVGGAISWLTALSDAARRRRENERAVLIADFPEGL